jgi:hypothetical protein
MTYRVLLHGGRGEAHARVPQALVACMREHLRAAGLLHVVDFFNAALLALRCRAEGFEVLLVGEDVGKVRCGLLQRASGPYGFGRLFVCGMDCGRVDGVLCQIAQGASRGCLGQALLGCDVRHVVLLLLSLRPGVSSTRRGQDRWMMRAQATVQGAGMTCKNVAFSESATKARDSTRQAEGCSSNVVVAPSRWRLGKSHPGRPDHSRLVAGFPGSLPPPESGHPGRHHRSSLRRRVKSRRELHIILRAWPATVESQHVALTFASPASRLVVTPGLVQRAKHVLPCIPVHRCPRVRCLIMRADAILMHEHIQPYVIVDWPPDRSRTGAPSVRRRREGAVRRVPVSTRYLHSSPIHNARLTLQLAQHEGLFAKSQG